MDRSTLLFILCAATFLSVATCDSLPWCANTTGGRRPIKTIENALDSEVVQVQWVSPLVIFILTDKGVLWRSGDAGVTFQNQLSSMPLSSLSSAGIQTISNSSDPDILYFLGYEGMLWVTSNAGAKYDYYNLKVFSNDLSVHPLNPDWVLVTGVPAGNVYVSTDRARTFRKSTVTVARAPAWEVGFSSTNQAVWVLYDSPSGSGDLSLGRAANVVDLVTGTVQEKVQRCAGFLFDRNRFLLAATIVDGGLNLQSSDDFGASFHLVRLPDEDRSQKKYTVLDDSEGSVFLNVDHGEGWYGDVYTSNTLGTNFTRSLTFNARFSGGRAAFQRMQGLEGIYVANEVSEGADKQKSLMTFNKGGRWQSIDAAKRADGSCLCKPDCSIVGDPNCRLHLNVLAKNRRKNTFDWEPAGGPLHSSRTAIGLYMGTGNIGSFLRGVNSDTATFISSNAGLDWKLFAQGAMIYDFADHGGIIVAASNQETTTSLYYSLDQGSTAPLTCTFTNTPLKVDNILANPSTQISRDMILFGSRTVDGMTKGFVVRLDLKDTFAAACSDADYEDFIPVDHKGGICLMGQRTTYRRRKPDSQCFNEQKEELIAQTKPCDCTANDFECALCYEDNKGVCVLNPKCDATPLNCPAGTTWDMPSLRKVVGNKCDETNFQVPVNAVPCPPQSSTGGGVLTGGSSGPVVLVVLLLLLGALAGGSGIAYWKNQRFKGWVDGLLANPQAMYVRLTGRTPANVPEQNEFNFEAAAAAASDEESGRTSIPSAAAVPATSPSRAEEIVDFR